MKNEEMARLFSEATPYIQKYHGKTMVVKYGGNAMINEELKNAVMNDLVTLTLLGVRVVLVHGGGPAINEMLKKVGVESHFANGLRVTDDATMEIVQQVLAGKVNKDLVAKLRGRGVGLCGMDGQMLRCTELDPQLGHVGEIIHVDPTLISTLLDETMGNYPYMYEHKVAYTARLEVRFRQPVRIGERIRVITKVKRRKGQLLEMTGQVVREDGTVAAEADGKLMYEERS